MRDPEEIEELIYQSVRESNLFSGEWEGMMYSNLLKMILIKGGGIAEFLEHFSPYFDLMDLEYYFATDLAERYGDEGYRLFVDMIIGDVR